MQNKPTIKTRVSTYYELSKPKIWYLLVFTAFGAALTASNIYGIHLSVTTWALVLGSVASGSAAANVLTNYHDRDIDAIMERTKDRPIPSGRITPINARNFGSCTWSNLHSWQLVPFHLRPHQYRVHGLWCLSHLALQITSCILVYCKTKKLRLCCCKRVSLYKECPYVHRYPMNTSPAMAGIH